MRVLILTQWYPPEPAELMHELAQSLQKLGHQVTVLTGFPNYPSGKLYPGYRLRFYQHERLDDVPVVRVPLYPEHSRSAIRRVLNYVSFSVSSLLLAPWLMPKPDVVFVYHPPLTVGMPAYALSRLWRIPFVFQIQDLWPESLQASGMLNNDRILGWSKAFADRVYQWAAAICVISPGFRENLISKGVPAEKIHVISNWVDTEAYYPAEVDSDLGEILGFSNQFNVMYAGNIGEGQGLETLVEAAALVDEALRIQVMVVGDGIALPRLKKFVEERGIDNVRFLGRFPQQDMPAMYALTDILLVHLKDDPLYRITIPHKIFSYMASGKPVLAAVAGDAAAVIADAGAGLTCPPSDPQRMAQRLNQFAAMPDAERQMMADRGLDAVRRLYSREVLVGKIEGVSSVCSKWRESKNNQRRGYHMNSELAFRPFSAGDESSILSLFELSYGHELGEHVWAWRFRDNPSGPGLIDSLLGWRYFGSALCRHVYCDADRWRGLPDWVIGYDHDPS